MSDIGSTNIDSLPTIQEDNKIDNNTENIIINNPSQKITQERKKDNKQNKNNESHNQNISNMQNDINNQIMQASSDGVTSLPSRDIPMNTNIITNDEEIKNDFVPQDKNSDYITEHLSTEDIIKQNINKNEDELFLDTLYSELSLPLLISILYFIFKLPFVDNLHHNILPFCFTKTGNMKISGYLTTSLIFGIIVYLLNKIIKNISI